MHIFYPLILSVLSCLSLILGILCVFLSFRWCSSKRIKEGADKSQISWFWAKQESMLRHDEGASQSKSREQHAASWLDYAIACQSQFKWRILKSCRCMTNPYRIMTTLEGKNLAYFWKIGFNVLGYLL